MVHTKGFTVLTEVSGVHEWFAGHLTLYRTKGIGTKHMARKASRLLAHATPSLLYIAAANRGKPAPKLERIRSLPECTVSINRQSMVMNFRTSIDRRDIVRISVAKVVEPIATDQ